MFRVNFYFCSCLNIDYNVFEVDLGEGEERAMCLKIFYLFIWKFYLESFKFFNKMGNF